MNFDPLRLFPIINSSASVFKMYEINKHYFELTSSLAIFRWFRQIFNSPYRSVSAIERLGHFALEKQKARQGTENSLLCM